MLNCDQCMAFTWKTFRSRFLRQVLWVGVAREAKGTSKDPPSSHVSTSIIAKAIADIEGFEQYQDLMSDAAKCFKRFNSQASAPLDVSSSLSTQEELASSSTEGEGGEANSSSAIEESSSERKSVQTTADIHNIDNSSKVSSQTQQKEQTVIQMDTDGVNGQKRGEASSSDEESSRGAVCSENPELQDRVPVESRGRVGGVQSLYGGVHSVANETLLNSRVSSSSSSIRATDNRDSTLDCLSRSQFLDPRSRSSRASASTTRDVASSQAFEPPTSVTAETPALTSLEEWRFEASRTSH